MRISSHSYIKHKLILNAIFMVLLNPECSGSIYSCSRALLLSGEVSSQGDMAT